jgi:hypothetical protein
MKQELYHALSISVHIPGITNIQPDALSRLSAPHPSTIPEALANTQRTTLVPRDEQFWLTERPASRTWEKVNRTIKEDHAQCACNSRELPDGSRVGWRCIHLDASQAHSCWHHGACSLPEGFGSGRTTHVAALGRSVAGYCVTLRCRFLVKTRVHTSTHIEPLHAAPMGCSGFSSQTAR